jgi:hypothetical protein
VVIDVFPVCEPPIQNTGNTAPTVLRRPLCLCNALISQDKASAWLIKFRFDEIIFVVINFKLFAAIPVIALLIGVSACSGLSVRGTVGGQTIATRVDSEAARYYLANYLAGKHNNPILDARIDQVYQTSNGHLPDRTELKELSDEFSVDFAALFMADQIARVPVNRRFRSAYDQAYEYTRKAFPKGRM